MAMKNIIGIACILFSIVGFAQKAEEDLTVTTFNVRYNSPDDGISVWENRKEWLTKSIRFFEADLVGAQIVTYPQLEDMEALLPSYAHVGVGREGGKKGELTPIVYKKNGFELLEHNTFWLSETPEKVYLRSLSDTS